MSESSLVEIDGSMGEGGGQMLRSSLALSMVTGRPVKLYNIRAKRSNPGLMRQHLAAVHAAIDVSNAAHSDVKLGSKELIFEPNAVCGLHRTFQIGSAGSCTLVLQTILPALVLATDESKITVEGGTHNPMAPPFEFLERSYLPILNTMGPEVSIELLRHGFYPKGGGKVQAFVRPAKNLQGIALDESGNLKSRSANACISRLPSHIAERELSKLKQLLKWKSNECHARDFDAICEGNYVFVELKYDHVTEVFSAIGARGKPAESVARELAEEVREYLSWNVPIGKHLADQIMLPMAISAWQGRQLSTPPKHSIGGSFITGPLTDHSKTHIEIIKAFMNVDILVESMNEVRNRVTIT